MLQEIAEQPAALEKTIAEERRKVEQLGQALARREIRLNRLSCAWQFRQCGPVRSVPAGNQDWNSRLAVCAIRSHSLSGEA